MSLTNIRVAITLIATLTAIVFIILINIFPEQSLMILTIETLLLPTIYIIGNYYAEDLIENRYRKIIEFITKVSKDLNERYINEKLLNVELKRDLKWQNKKNQNNM